MGNKRFIVSLNCLSPKQFTTASNWCHCIRVTLSVSPSSTRLLPNVLAGFAALYPSTLCACQVWESFDQGYSNVPWVSHANTSIYSTIPLSNSCDCSSRPCCDYAVNCWLLHLVLFRVIIFASALRPHHDCRVQRVGRGSPTWAHIAIRAASQSQIRNRGRGLYQQHFDKSADPRAPSPGTWRSSFFSRRHG